MMDVESTTDIIQQSAEESVEHVQTQVSEIVTFFQEHIPDMLAFGVRVSIRS